MHLLCTCLYLGLVRIWDGLLQKSS